MKKLRGFLVGVLAVAGALGVSLPAFAAYGLTQSALLNGSSQYLDRADTGSLSQTGDQTHEGWLQFTDLPSSGEEWHLFNKYTASAGERAISVVYENSGGTLRFHARVSADGSSVTEGTLNYTITADEWHHYRFVYTASAGTIDVYVDESSIGQIPALDTAIINNTAPYRLGFQPDFGNYFQGNISLWRVWNEVHTDADSCIVYGTVETGMMAEWSLDGVLTDASTNGNNLTNNGSVTFPSDVPSVCTGGGGTTTTTSTPQFSEEFQGNVVLVFMMIVFLLFGWSAYKLSGNLERI